ncbi:MAG: MerR family DNA-binding transcriptional regulator [Coxiellaceae bacterium]|nr:MerR family DNA-binding transcriptional regulator [Coxiellaceae bacterium]
MAEQQTLTIGQLAKLSNINISTLRHYERQGLLIPKTRTAAGYRLYSSSQVAILKFIMNAKSVGLKLTVIKDLIDFAHRKEHITVVDRMSEHLEEVQHKIAELKKIESAIKELVGNCERHKSFDECPSIRKLFGFDSKCDI